MNLLLIHIAYVGWLVREQKQRREKDGDEMHVEVETLRPHVEWSGGL